MENSEELSTGPNDDETDIAGPFQPGYFDDLDDSTLDSTLKPSEVLDDEVATLLSEDFLALETIERNTAPGNQTYYGYSLSTNSNQVLNQDATAPLLLANADVTLEWNLFEQQVPFVNQDTPVVPYMMDQQTAVQPTNIPNQHYVLQPPQELPAFAPPQTAQPGPPVAAESAGPNTRGSLLILDSTDQQRQSEIEDQFVNLPVSFNAAFFQLDNNEVPADPLTAALNRDVCPDVDHTSSTKQGIDFPSESYVELIVKALLSSERQRMTITELYEWFGKMKACFTKDNLKSWKNGVRNKLTTEPYFIKCEKSGEGRQHYWSINPEHLEKLKKGDFRIPAGRGRRGSNAVASTSNSRVTEPTPTAATSSSSIWVLDDSQVRPELQLFATLPQQAIDRTNQSLVYDRRPMLPGSRYLRAPSTPSVPTASYVDATLPASGEPTAPSALPTPGTPSAPDALPLPAATSIYGIDNTYAQHQQNESSANDASTVETSVAIDETLNEDLEYIFNFEDQQ